MENSEIQKINRVKNVFVKLINTIAPGYKFPGGGQPILYIYKGLDYMQARYFPLGMADERIVDCIIYQVYRYRKFYEEGKADYKWCFSHNAIDKFYAQFFGGGKGTGMKYYINQWLDENNINRKSLIDMIASPKANPYTKFLYMHSEELIKQRFLNQEVGYLLCQNNTLGWSPLSQTCQKCQFIDKCINDTAIKYPEIIRLRKEYQQKNG